MVSITPEGRGFAKEAWKILEEKQKEIDWIINNTVNQGNLGYWQILCALCQGASSWSQLKASVKVSEPILSKKLKQLQKMGLVKRSIIAGFPPSTKYEFNRDFLSEEDIKDLTAPCQLMRQLNEAADIRLKEGATIEDPLAEKLLNILMNDLEVVILFELKFWLQISPSPLSRPEVFAVFAAFTNWAIMKRFWVLYEVLTLSFERRGEAIKLLSERIEALRDTLTDIPEAKIYLDAKEEEKAQLKKIISLKE